MLRHNRPFLALCGARAISGIGDQVAAVALVLLIAKTHPATAVGGLLLAESLPMLLSTHAGVVADKLEGRSLLIGCQVGQGLIFGLITVWLPPYAILLALLAIASLMGTALRSATQTAMRDLVPPDQRLAANSMLSVALFGGVMLGPAIGGALAGFTSPRVALAVDTITFGVSAATLLMLPLLPAMHADEDDSGSAMAALRHAWGDPILRSIILAMTMLVAFAGVDNVALVFLVRDSLGGGSVAYGVAMAVFGIGMVSGSALIARHSTRWRAERLLSGTFAATGAGTAILAGAPTLGFVYPAQFIGGAANGIDVAAQTTLVQQRAPASMLGRLSGAINSAVAVGFLVAYLGGGALVDATSPRTAFWVAAVGTFAAVFVLTPVWRSAPPPAPTSRRP